MGLCFSHKSLITISNTNMSLCFYVYMVKIIAVYATEKQIQKCDVKITDLLYIFIFRGKIESCNL